MIQMIVSNIISDFVCCLSVQHFILINDFKWRQIDEINNDNNCLVSCHHVILCWHLMLYQHL